MKTERRHELQTNVLASSLAHWVEVLKPYGRGIVAGVLAIVGVLLAWMYISSQNKAQEVEGWNRYFRAVNTRDQPLLRDVAQQYAGTMVANWARLTTADWQLESGTNRLLSDRTLARDDLREASETFQALASVSNQSVRERAAFGLARAYESLGELEKARAEYRKIAETWPNSPYAEQSKSRAEALEQNDTKQFYDWVAKYEPPAPFSNEPGTPGKRPDFLKEPDAGTLNVPSSLGDSAVKFPSLGLDEPAEKPAESAETAAAEPDLPAAEPAADSDAPK
jgi:tetratricopeptide (TPR) repeat protein